MSTKCQSCWKCIPLTPMTLCWHFPLATDVERGCVHACCHFRQQRSRVFHVDVVECFMSNFKQVNTFELSSYTSIVIIFLNLSQKSTFCKMSTPKCNDINAMTSDAECHEFGFVEQKTSVMTIISWDLINVMRFLTGLLRVLSSWDSYFCCFLWCIYPCTYFTVTVICPAPGKPVTLGVIGESKINQPKLKQKSASPPSLPEITFFMLTGEWTGSCVGFHKRYLDWYFKIISSFHIYILCIFENVCIIFHQRFNPYMISIWPRLWRVLGIPERGLNLAGGRRVA